MNGPDRDNFWKAMEIELGTLTDDADAWDVVDGELWMKVPPSTWAFRLKRNPSGSLRKIKAQFCARGDQQEEGIDFFDRWIDLA